MPNKDTCFISPNLYPRSLWLHWYFSIPIYILPLHTSMFMKASRFVFRISECKQQWISLHELDIAHLVCVPNGLKPLVSVSQPTKEHDVHCNTKLNLSCVRGTFSGTLSNAQVGYSKPIVSAEDNEINCRKYERQFK